MKARRVVISRSRFSLITHLSVPEQARGVRTP